MTLRVGVLGGGAFGRGIASAARRGGCEVTLISRAVDALEGVSVHRDAAALVPCELVFVCVPSHVIFAAADELAEHLDGRHKLVHVSRGLLGDDLVPLSTVLREKTACRRVGVLAGPLVADALSQGLPGGAIVGTRFPEVATLVRESLGGEALRVYDTDDIAGVELASACVGVLALALGVVRALGLGPATLATVATRGIHEAARLGDAYGADRVTFGGLAGMGDLVAVVAGDARAEATLGARLARGVPLDEAVREVGSHVESIDLVARLVAYGGRVNVPTPIFSAVANVVSGRLVPEQALRDLMSRRLGRES